jgi:alkanesulfonate monooxygenase SsuD/methylene tetrahydromethanopterin reductase-like flavin-dependent oxidoreductase (luciferase family)
MVEAYTTLGYLAACTTLGKLLTLVTGALYRHPGILAKTVTTLDVLSGGRAWLGIGIGPWNDEDDNFVATALMGEYYARLAETWPGVPAGDLLPRLSQPLQQEAAFSACAPA